MSPEIKEQIDRMSYEGMLRIWRHAPVGDPMFQGETGKYFSKVMKEKSSATSLDDRVAASKRVGW